MLAGKARHSGVINCTFLDGHAKAIAYDKLIDDPCLWVTEVPVEVQWRQRPVEGARRYLPVTARLACRS